MKPELFGAFEKAKYRIVEQDFELSIGKNSNEIDQLLVQTYTQSWALITPFNPGSRVISDKENDERLRRMMQDVKRFKVLDSEGGGNDNSPIEKGFLILGINRSEAVKLGKKYGQDAIVFGYREKPAEIVVLNKNFGRGERN